MPNFLSQGWQVSISSLSLHLPHNSLHYNGASAGRRNTNELSDVNLQPITSSQPTSLILSSRCNVDRKNVNRHYRNDSILNSSLTTVSPSPTYVFSPVRGDSGLMSDANDAHDLKRNGQCWIVPIWSMFQLILHTCIRRIPWFRQLPNTIFT